MDGKTQREDSDENIQLSIVIPAYNEESGIAQTLSQLIAAFPEDEIIVVDDGSSDTTADTVRKGFEGVHLVRQPFNRGYGASLKVGMRHARGEYIAWFDADNEHRPENLVAMFDQIRSERLAAVLGQRSNSQSLVRGAGKYVIRVIARILKVKAGTDLNCGLRIFKGRIIKQYLHLLPDGYSASLTSTVIMLERGYPFAFRPVSTNPRLGVSKVALSDGFEALILLLRVITLFAPMRIFLRISLILILPGLLYGAALALFAGRGFPVAAALMINTGVVLGAIGLVADQISQMRLISLNRRSSDVDAELPDEGTFPKQKGITREDDSRSKRQGA